MPLPDGLLGRDMDRLISETLGREPNNQYERDYTERVVCHAWRGEPTGLPRDADATMRAVVAAEKQRRASE